MQASTLAVAALLLGSTAAHAQFTTYRIVNDLRGDFTSAGTALRGTGPAGTGTITIAGVPGGSVVKEAILYWTVLDIAPGQPAAGNIAFAGQAITGELYAIAGSPCAPADTSYLYRADVTPFVAASGNGSYLVSGYLDSGDSNLAPITEGASLIVIYSNLSLADRDIVVYDGAGLTTQPGQLATMTLANFDGTTPVTGATIGYIVADGESSKGDDAIFNGITFPNIFDGSAPPALIEFWDDDILDVTGFVPGGSLSATAQIQQNPDDCLLWAATPFSVTSNMPAVDVISDNATPIVQAGAGSLQINYTVINSTLVNQPILANIFVYRGNGRLLGTLIQQPRGGTIPPLTVLQKTLTRNIPSGVAATLRNQPLRVVTQITNRVSGTFIDDDYVIFWIQ